MMKTMRLLLLAALLGASASALPAYAQIGFAAGLNLDRLSDVELIDGPATFENSNGWHAELWLELPLGALSLRPGLRYLDAGALYRSLSDDYRDVPGDVAVNLVEIPLNLRLRLQGRGAAPYLVGGPVLRFPFADDEGLNDDLRTVGVAGGLGVGLELPLGVLRLFPELSYTFGLSSFVDDAFHIGNREFVIDDSQYLNTIMLRVGVAL